MTTCYTSGVVRYTILLHLLEEQHVPQKKCNCVRQRCHGVFIQYYENQETCIWDLAEKDLLKTLTPIYGQRKENVSQRKKEA